MLLFGPWYHLRKQNDINGKITSLGIGMNFSSDSYWKSFRASQVSLVVKNLPANPGDAGNTGDVGSVPGSGRCPGGDHDNPLQYSCLENSMNRGGWQATVHRVAKSRTRLKWLRTAQSFKDLFKEDGAKTQFSSFLEPSLPVPCPPPPCTPAPRPGWAINHSSLSSMIVTIHHRGLDFYLYILKSWEFSTRIRFRKSLGIHPRILFLSLYFLLNFKGTNGME